MYTYFREAQGHFNIYKQENNILSLYEPENAEFLDIYILMSI